MLNPHSASPDAEQVPGQIFTEPQFRGLKVAVVAMALVLIIGFGVVIGRIIYLFQQPSPSASNAPATVARADRTLALPAGAIVRHVAITADRLAVHYEAPSGAGIRIMDLASGTEQTVRVTTAAP